MSVAEQLIAKGIEQGIEQVVEAMLKKGMAVEEIAELIDLPREEIEKIADRLG